MSKSDLVGKKVIGFEFVGGPGFSEKMKKYVGKVGVVTRVSGDRSIANVDFGDDSWYYPLDKLTEHLVVEDLFDDGKLGAPYQPVKELVPVIDASTFMEVSDNPTFVGRPARREVFCKIGDVYVSKDEVGMFEYWTYVRPIKPLELTLEQIAEKFGVQNIRIV
jgi:hypothetical protein